MDECPDYAPGEKLEGYHIPPQNSTHVACMHRVKQTDGQMWLVTAEAGPKLDTDYATKGTWKKNESPNLPGTFLDAANGGVVEHETMNDRLPKHKSGKNSGEEQKKSSRMPVTNVTICLVHQQSYIPNWWAKQEMKNPIGFGPRFVHTFAHKPHYIKNRAHEGFNEKVFLPFIQKMFERYLKFLGPKAAIDDIENWKMDGDALNYEYLIESIAALRDSYRHCLGVIFLSATFGLNVFEIDKDYTKIQKAVVTA